METKAQTILEAATDSQLALSVIQTYKDLEKNYFLRAWKVTALDAGHFVETIRRFVDCKLFGSYTPIGTALSPLNDKELRRLEGMTGEDSYRLHIPRSLQFIYGLRNKRGIGHLSNVPPNYLDATVILACCKWILAEILRLESNLSFNDTVQIVDGVVERPVPGLWKLVQCVVF